MKAQELKNSILQLAVQGKLVPQDTSETPAHELLKEIKAEKERLIKEGKLKKEKSMPSISENEIPFEIPESWQWIRLGDFCSIYNGNSINANEKVEKYSRPCEGHVFIATKDVGFDNQIDYENGIYIPYSEDSFKIAPADSVLLCMEGGSAGRKIGLLDRAVCFGNKLCCLSPIKVDSKYLFYFLQTPAFFSAFRGSMTGIIGGVGAAKIRMIHIPIPPLAEQKRIVARIEELLPLVAEYDAAESRLSEINSTFPDKLRKSILQQAVQGKLTERGPADEPASELLKRIRAEKERLIKEGKLKKDKPLPPIAEDEIPFEIPEMWEWVRFSDVIDVATNLVLPDEYGSYMHIAPDNIEKNTGRLLECRTVKADHVESPNHLFEEGQLIYSKIRPLLRKVVIAPFRGLCSADMYPLNTSMVKEYIRILLLSECFSLQVAAIASNRIKMPKINQKELSRIIIPIPPFFEQQRIVARVEELLALCDRLK